MNLRDDADVGDVRARRRVVARDRQLERRAVVEWIDRLHECLAERSLAHERRTAVVTQRRRDDLGRARAEAIDEDDERQPRRDAADRTKYLVRLVPADERDHDAAVEE